MSDKIDELIAKVEQLTAAVAKLSKPEILEDTLLLEICLPETLEGPEGESSHTWQSTLHLPGKAPLKQSGFVTGDANKAFLIAVYAGLQQAGFFYKPDKKLLMIVPSNLLAGILEGFMSVASVWSEENLAKLTRIQNFLGQFESVEILTQESEALKEVKNEDWYPT